MEYVQHSDMKQQMCLEEQQQHQHCHLLLQHKRRQIRKVSSSRQQGTKTQCTDVEISIFVRSEAYKQKQKFRRR